MLKLCGFHVSNYHNKVRIALLEKDIPFEEDPTCRPSQKDEFLARTPIGKVPWIELDGGGRISESHVICEYLEDAYPQKPLLPKDPLERAKVRELIVYLELHLELVVRRLYPSLFFGGNPLSDGAKQAIEADLSKGLRGLKALARFSPYIAGAQLTLADCAAFVHLPLVSLSTKLAYGRDFLDDLPQAKPYIKMLGERPAFARVNEDRKAASAAAAARAKDKAGAK
jgi:glutathione S-transferase